MKSTVTVIVHRNGLISAVANYCVVNPEHREEIDRIVCAARFSEYTVDIVDSGATLLTVPYHGVPFGHRTKGN